MGCKMGELIFARRLNNYRSAFKFLNLDGGTKKRLTSMIFDIIIKSRILLFFTLG